jgi:hypothetical protein
VCRGPIEHENTNTARMGVYKDRYRDPDLFNQLLQVPPCIECFAWVNDLSGLKRSQAELRWKLKLLTNLLLR